MENNKKRRKTILVSLMITAAVLFLIFAACMANSARIRAALEEARDLLEAGKVPITTAPKEPIKTDGYLRLRDGTIGAMKLYYYGDDTFYGRGAGVTPAVMAEGASSTLLHLDIAAAYGRGGSIGGRIPNYSPTPYTTEVAAYDFGINLYLPMDFRLAILSPSDAVIEQNKKAALSSGYSGALTGEAGKDIETLVLSIRERAPRCDILLAIPHNASNALAAAMLEIGAHYNLITVDLRSAVVGEGMLHTDGADAGYPTKAGHRAIADAILAAIREAVVGGHFTEGVPSTKLY